MWDLSCLNVQGIFSVDLKKFLDFFKLHTLFFFFPLLVSMCTRTEKLCLSQKNNGSFLQKKKRL